MKFRIHTDSLILVILTIYACFAFSFAFERILCIDNSFSFYQIVNSKNFWLPENRIGIFASQIPVLLGASFGLSLNMLVYVYSLSFIVEYCLIAWICYKILAVKEAALCIALCLIIGVSHSFFHPVTETYHALVLSCIVYSFIVSPVTSKLPAGAYYVCLLLLVAWSLLSHPVGIFTIAFVGIFTFTQRKISGTKVSFLVLLLMAVSLVRVIFSNEKSYDSQQYTTLFSQVENIKNITTLYPFQFIHTHLADIYLPFLIIALVSSILAYIQKELKLLIIVFILAGGYFVLGILTFASGDADIMMQKTFLPGIFMFLLLFSYQLYNLNRHLQTAIACFVFCLCIFSFYQINTAGKMYTVRLHTLTQLLSQQKHPKVIASYSDFRNDDLKLNHWNTGIDALILAKSKLNQSKTIFLIDNKTTYPFDSTNLDLFLGPTWWPMWNNREMDSNYFYLPSATYHLLKPNELQQ